MFPLFTSSFQVQLHPVNIEKHCTEPRPLFYTIKRTGILYIVLLFGIIYQFNCLDSKFVLQFCWLVSRSDPRGCRLWRQQYFLLGDISTVFFSFKKLAPLVSALLRAKRSVVLETILFQVKVIDDLPTSRWQKYFLSS